MVYLACSHLKALATQMPNHQKIYDSDKSKVLSLNDLLRVFRRNNAHRVIFKVLSPNDNSKNQPYLAGHLGDIGFIPTRDPVASVSTSSKTSNVKRKIKFTADLNFSWIDGDGKPYEAPYAKLIYYPQYPEVRLSGFLQGCPIDMGGWMDPTKKGRTEGRVLFLGIRQDEKLFAYLATPNSRLATEIEEYPSTALSAVLREVPSLVSMKNTNARSANSRKALVTELQRIHKMGPIQSKKLNKNGVPEVYQARNGGGYTLEAELGILPNGLAEPDFQGWEIKQFAVKKFQLIDSKVLSLITPEPDGGHYKTHGVRSFISRYGYNNATITDRRDFTGRHLCNLPTEKTGLTLVLQGYDAAERKISDAAGYLGLIDQNDNLAASWSFSKLLTHWNKKHAKAAYIPAVAIDQASQIRQYYFGNLVRLYEGTTFENLLNGINDKNVYYDPGIKVEHVSNKAVVKKRSQFRIKSRDLGKLYHRLEEVDVNQMPI